LIKIFKESEHTKLIGGYEEVFFNILLNGVYVSRVLVKRGVLQEGMIEGIKRRIHVKK